MWLGALMHDFFSLIFPRVCHACGITLAGNEECICTSCLFHMPRTHFSLQKENKLTEIFWGRVSIETGSALFYFQKGGRVQNLIHRFKYKGFKEIGHYLGVIHGSELKQSELYHDLDMIVPVPLHPHKVRIRGFNQSQVYGEGLSKSLKIPLISEALQRIVPTSSQTRKTRFRRWENVGSVFYIPNSDVFENKNILLVDDVLTTGSTLEACAQKLVEIKGVRVWVATIAITI